MRIKSLSAIVSFLLISFAMSSCLGDDEPIVYSSNPLIQSFALDTVKGKDYLFTIDQLRGKIYNQDSLPVGSDTIIDKILITTLNVTGVVTVRNSADTADSLLNTSDSLNFVGTMEKPFMMKVWAPNGIDQKTYALEVRVHQQQPDSLNWGDAPLVTNYAPGISGKQKSIIFDNQIYLYADAQPVHITALSDGKNWRTATATGLPNTNVTSLVQFMGKLYATVDGSSNAYVSTDGISWSDSGLGNDIVVLISPINDILTAIRNVAQSEGEAAEQRFCDTDGTTWAVGDTVPSNFPQNNISAALYTTSIGVENLVIVGNTVGTQANDTVTVPWAYMQGQEWVALSTDTRLGCPKMEDPTIMYYNDQFYIFGNSFTNFYTSEAGIIWSEVTEMFLFPEAIRDRQTDYSSVVDDENRIWIMLDTPNEVWRGKLNRLGFLFQ